MKLSCECVRDILLCLENFPFIGKNEDGELEADMMPLDAIVKALPNYSEAEILYALLRLKEGGYIDVFQKKAGSTFYLFFVTDMTFAGHELLEKIRPESNWEKTLSVLKKVGSFGLDLLSSVSGNLLTAEASRWLTGG